MLHVPLQRKVPQINHVLSARSRRCRNSNLLSARTILISARTLLISAKTDPISASKILDTTNSNLLSVRKTAISARTDLDYALVDSAAEAARLAMLRGRMRKGGTALGAHALSDRLCLYI